MTCAAPDGCSRRAETRGLCRMHYQRWRKHGDLSARRRGPQPGTPTYRAPESVKDKVVRRSAIDANGCWVWQGSIDEKGYGRTTVGSRVDGTYRTGRVHRLSYEAWRGPIPEGLVPDHLCRNRSCCNPEHLELVTPGENTLRGQGPTAINARKTTCQSGHELRAQDSRGKRTCVECARERRRRWKRKNRPGRRVLIERPLMLSDLDNAEIRRQVLEGDE